MNTTASFLPEPSWSRRCSTETVFSIQGRETDFVQDSSDTDLDSEDEDLEYEPVTESEGDVPISGATSGQSDDELISKKVVRVSDDEGDDGATQRPDSASSLASDSEQEMPAYASCARCRHALENTRYRYCDKCFKLRKNFFPPRPRRKTKRESTSQEIPTVMSQDSGIESLHSQDLTSSQEIRSQDIFNQGTSGKDILSQGTSSQEILSQANSSPEILSQGTSSHNILSQDIFSQELSSQDIPSQGQSSQDIFDQVPSSQDSLSGSTSQGHAETPKETEARLGKLKRRSESADRTYKRPRLDSESDCESNRKVNVAPLIKTISDPAVTIETIDSKSDSKDLCIICFNEPKSGVFVHRRVAHICCCYNCAVKVWSKARRCPVCNCKVSNVLKAVVM